MTSNPNPEEQTMTTATRALELHNRQIDRLAFETIGYVEAAIEETDQDGGVRLSAGDVAAIKAKLAEIDTNRAIIDGIVAAEEEKDEHGPAGPLGEEWDEPDVGAYLRPAELESEVRS